MNPIRSLFVSGLVSGLFVAGMTGVAFADDNADTAKMLIEKAQTSSLAWDLVESLTTEIGPRLGGSAAEARARDWAVRKLEGLGFANVHVEDFEMDGWRRGDIALHVGDPYPQRLIATALGGSVGTPVGGITASVVRFESIQDLREAPLGSLKGKIAYVADKMTRSQRGSGYGVAVQKRGGGASVASERGALAIVIRSAGTDYERQPHTGGVRYNGEFAAIPAAALSNNDADQLDRLLALNGDIELTLSMSAKRLGKVKSGNVIGDIIGSEYPDEIVLLGAHLDSWDEGTGAIDDGTGVAIVTAAAALVAQHATPKRTIRVVLFGAEEQGLIGARAYVKANAEEMEKIIMVSESDFGSGRIWRMDTGIAKADVPKADAILRVLRPLGVLPGDRTASGGSDVSALSAAGAPAISMGQNGWDYFDLHHTPNDTLDKIDPDDLAQNVAVYAAFALMVANTDGGFHAPEKETEDGN